MNKLKIDGIVIENHKGFVRIQLVKDLKTLSIYDFFEDVKSRVTIKLDGEIVDTGKTINDPIETFYPDDES